MASDKNPSSNAASSSPSLDRDLLAILAGTLPFSNIEALIAFFLTQAEGHLARIRAVLSEANLAALARQAHSLVSVAGNAGAMA